MNKNPDRPKNMNELMSECFNPNYKKKKKGKYWEAQEEILKEIFE